MPGHQRNMCSYITLMEDYPFYVPDTFCCCLQLNWLGALLVALNCSVFQKTLHTRGLPSSPTIYTTSPLDENWPLVWLVVVHFTCFTVSSILRFYTVYTFHCLSQFVLKTEYLHLRESNVEIWSRKFFHLTYVEPKHRSDEHNHTSANDFQCIIWILWVCWLSPAWYNVDCSQLMSWFDLYRLQLVTHPWSIVQQEISSMKLCKPLLTHSVSHSAFFTHYKFFFALQLHLY